MRRLDNCPPWCDDHYTAPDGGRYCARSSITYVEGVNARTAARMSAMAWIEQHQDADSAVPHVIGVLRIEHDEPSDAPGEQPHDIELTRVDVLRYADQLVRLAAQIHETEARFAPTSVADLGRTRTERAADMSPGATRGGARTKWARRVTRRRGVHRAA